MQTAASRVQILSEALPYIQKFQGRTVVVKYGGAAMKDDTLKDKVIRDIVFMACVGIHPVLVHGGGPEINTWLDKLGIEPQFKDGLRVTNAPTMDVVEMVLVGRVNKELVGLVNAAGGSAVGLRGKDGNMITARPQGATGIGFVGVDTSGLDFSQNFVAWRVRGEWSVAGGDPFSNEASAFLGDPSVFQLITPSVGAVNAAGTGDPVAGLTFAAGFNAGVAPALPLIDVVLNGGGFGSANYNNSTPELFTASDLPTTLARKSVV